MITRLNRALQARGLLVLKLVVTTGILTWLFRSVRLDGFMVAIRHISPVGIVLAGGLVCGQALIAALRWHSILRYLGAGLSVIRTIELFWTGLFFAAISPGGLAGDGARMWMLASTGSSAPKSINSVVLDRLAALAGLVLLVAASLPFVDDRVASQSVRYGTAAFLSLGLLASFAFVTGFQVPTAWQRSGAGRAAGSLLSDLKMLCWPLRRPLTLALLSVLTVASFAFAVFVLLRSVGSVIGPLDCMVLVPLIVLATTLPVSFGGWGLREGSMVGLFALVGISPADAFSVSIVAGLLSTAASLPGALVWLRTRRPAPQPLPGSYA